jgi:hypothetical protein
MAAVSVPNFWAPQLRQAKTALENRDSTGHGTGTTDCHSVVVGRFERIGMRLDCPVAAKAPDHRR